MFWSLLLVILLGGQQVELKDQRHFESLAACNEALAEYVNFRTSAPWAVTCEKEDHA